MLLLAGKYFAKNLEKHQRGVKWPLGKGGVIHFTIYVFSVEYKNNVAKSAKWEKMRFRGFDKKNNEDAFKRDEHTTYKNLCMIRSDGTRN